MNIPREAMEGLPENEGGLKRKTYPRNPEPQLRVQEADQAQVAPPANPPLNFQDADGYDYQAAPQTPQAPQVPQAPGQYERPQINPTDEELFPGGPYESQILSWKKQYDEVYLLELNDDVFIVRPLTRFEYKQIVMAPNTDPLMREEIISETCTLWPESLNFQTIASGKAGVPAMLSEQILEKSSFTRNVSVRAL